MVSHPVAGDFRTVAVPMRLPGQDVGPRGPAPELGQHTREVLHEIGLSAAELDALVADGQLPEQRSLPAAILTLGRRSAWAAGIMGRNWRPTRLRRTR